LSSGFRRLPEPGGIRDLCNAEVMMSYSIFVVFIYQFIF